jgi:UMF1 family MFS transporter
LVGLRHRGGWASPWRSFRRFSARSRTRRSQEALDRGVLRVRRSRPRPCGSRRRAPWAIPLALVAFALGTVAAEIAAVFNNAMMAASSARRARSPVRDGVGVGYAGGLAALVIALGFLAASPETGRTFFGLSPLFGLDPATREGDRVAGPFSRSGFSSSCGRSSPSRPDAPGTACPGGPRPGRPRPARRTLRDARTRPGLVLFLSPT